LLGQVLVAADGGMVGLYERDRLRPGLLADRGGCRLAGVRLAAGNDDMCTLPCEHPGGLVADAAGPAGDHDRPAG
jgi:hypothetical protein